MIEEPAKTLTTANSTDAAHLRHTINEFVAEPLMIPLAMIVLDVLRHRLPQVAFPEGNHSIETFLLDRAHEAFGIGIRVGGLKRSLHNANP